MRTYHSRGGNPVTVIGGVTPARDNCGDSYGYGAFDRCRMLTSIAIPQSVTVIMEEAFLGCSRLTSVTIPRDVTHIGDAAFAQCHSMEFIEVDPDNSEFVSIDGVLFSSDLKTLIQYPCAKVGAYTIPDGVTRIGIQAFRDCSSLTSIVIPGSLEYIGEMPWGGGLVRGPDKVESPFEGCLALTAIEVESENANFVSADGVLLSADLGTLYCYPASKAGTTYKIPESVGKIEWAAMSGSREMTSITIHESVSSIGSGAFANCSSLTSLIVDEGNTAFTSSEGVLFQGRTLVQYPGGKSGAYSIPDHVSSIQASAFAGCHGLTGVTFPMHLNWIAEKTFKNCGALKAITIPKGVTQIESEAFAHCSALSRVRLPKSLQNIYDRAFIGCEQLRGVIIPQATEGIGSQAFADCSSLQAAVFLGDAPGEFRELSRVFMETASEFSFHYIQGTSGFTSPTWRGYKATMIENSAHAAAPWLLSQGYAPDTDLSEDASSDGVSLLLAYALDLNPHVNLSGSMPMAVIDGGVMNMTFHQAREGIHYVVETSTDLKQWTIDGVTMSELDSFNRRTASVTRTPGQRYLRMVVTD